MRKVAAALVFTVLVGGASLAVTQFRGGGRDSGSYCGPLAQNDPPPTEFIIARWYPWDTGRQSGWSHDYPCAEQHILQVITETSIVDTQLYSYRIVEISSPEIFEFPFAYLSHPGDMVLTDEEVENVREYINRGGFIMMDDFGGQGAAQEAREWNGFWQNMQRIFPDREPFELTLDHPIFHMLYDIESINLVHPMQPSVASVFLGYPDGRGGLAAIICFRNDIGDFWEFIDNPRYPVEPSAEALKLGLNFVHYAMTH